MGRGDFELDKERRRVDVSYVTQSIRPRNRIKFPTITCSLPFRRRAAAYRAA